MQRHLKNSRVGITTGEAVELARERGITITRQTVRNLIGSGFLRNLDPEGGWYQIDKQEFLTLLLEGFTSGSVSVELMKGGPYHVKDHRRSVPPDAVLTPLNRGLQPLK